MAGLTDLFSNPFVSGGQNTSLSGNVTEQIVRESPEIEAYRLGLLDLAKSRAEVPVNLPNQQVAPLTAQQKQAMSMAGKGLGAYQPYLKAGMSNLNQADTMFGGIGSMAQGFANQGMNLNRDFTNSGVQMGQTLANQGLARGMGEGADAQGIASLMAQQAQGFAGQGQQQIFNPAMQAAQQGTNAGFMGAQGYNPNSAAGYMDPYQQQVTQRAIAEMDRAANQSRQAQASSAVSAGAFGGSRDAVLRAELERGLQDVKSNRIMEDYSRNFQQAQQASINNFQNQQARMQNAGQMAMQGGQMVSNAGIASLGLGANTALQSGQMLGGLGMDYANLLQSGGLNAAQLLGNQRLQAGQQLGQQALAGGQLATGAQLDAARGIASIGQQQGMLGGLAQAYGQADTSFLYNMGANAQKQNQAQLDTNYQNQLAKAYEPFQRIGFLSDIYSKTPTSQQTLTSQSAPEASPLSQIVGAGIAGYGALQAFNKASNSFGS